MLSNLQIMYMLGLAACFKPLNSIWCGMFCNLAAALSVCYLVDIGYMTIEEAAAWFLLTDVLTAAYLSLGNNLSKIIALGYVITAPIYVLPFLSTWAIVYPIAALQLGVLFVGNGGGGYFGRTHRDNHSRFSDGFSSSPVLMAVPD